MSKSNKKNKTMYLVSDSYYLGRKDGLVNGYLLGFFSGIITTLGIIAFKNKEKK